MVVAEKKREHSQKGRTEIYEWIKLPRKAEEAIHEVASVGIEASATARAITTAHNPARTKTCARLRM